MGLLRGLLGIVCYGGAAYFVYDAAQGIFLLYDGFQFDDLVFSLPNSIIAYVFYRMGKSCFSQPEKAIPTNTVKLTNEQIQAVFYRLIKTNKGKITVMRLAMETGLSGKEAQAYLDEQVKHFNADYEVNDKGEVTYRFPL